MDRSFHEAIAEDGIDININKDKVFFIISLLFISGSAQKPTNFSQFVLQIADRSSVGGAMPMKKLEDALVLFIEGISELKSLFETEETSRPRLILIRGGALDEPPDGVEDGVDISIGQDSDERDEI